MKHSFALSFGILSLCAVFLFSACKNSGSKSTSLTSAYCDCMNNNKNLPDSLKIDSCDRLVLADTLGKIETDSAAAAFLDDFDGRLQKDCKEYAALFSASDSTGSEDENWTEVDTAMESKLSDADCQEFFANQQFSYEEPDSLGSTTNVTIDNGVWNESLQEDKYFSKLNFKQDGGCGFSLIFTESNDPVKGKGSKKGDVYRYRVIDKKGNYYLVLGIVKGKGLLFKLYH